MAEITDHEFTKFQSFIFDEAGITLADTKKALVSGRLAKRLAHFRLDSYSEYLRLLLGRSDPGEVQIAVDLLTTNETYFFREPRHFDLLGQLAQEATREGRGLRVWSAASSTGEEPYSIAMVLADKQGDLPWSVLGTDLSSRVLRHARIGHYQQERASHVPPAYLKKYCLRGTGVETGTLLVQRALRDRVQFSQVNLNKPLPSLGPFDIIFLRNVLIYFNPETKRQVVQRLLGQLRPGGHLLVGHSETLNDINGTVRSVAPSIYMKP
ncbi:protein-glutamate O-methyltransferase CheR [Leptospira sp. 96542]|nr:protein-glutamate O-methyltransferase CheR [Leptospira sp. 96542]